MVIVSLLNVLSKVKTSQQADDWYSQMKDYCDPKKYTDQASMVGQWVDKICVMYTWH